MGASEGGNSVTRTRVSIVLTIFLLLVLGGMTWLAFGFSAQSRRVPIVVGVPTTLLLALQLVREIIAVRRGTNDGSDEFGSRGGAQEFGQASASAAMASSVEDGEPGGSDGSAVATVGAPDRAMRASVAQSFTWILLLAGAFYVFGMLLAVPVFVGLFMHFYGREPLRVILISVGATVAVLHFFFVVLLGIRLYAGIVGPWVGL